MIYSQNAPSAPNIYPAAFYPKKGSPLLGNQEFVRLTHTLNISDDLNTFTFKSNIGLVVFLLFFATIFSIFIGHKILIWLIRVIFRLDEDFQHYKFIIIFSILLSILVSLVYMIPTVTIIDFNNKKVSQKNIIFSVGKSTSLDNIKELQIIPKNICYEEDDDYEKECGLSYEFNLVLYDDSRINITDHFKYNQIKNEAALLSNRLKKPLVDYTH